MQLSHFTSLLTIYIKPCPQHLRLNPTLLISSPAIISHPLDGPCLAAPASTWPIAWRPVQGRPRPAHYISHPLCRCCWCCRWSLIIAMAVIKSPRAESSNKPCHYRREWVVVVVVEGGWLLRQHHKPVPDTAPEGHMLGEDTTDVLCPSLSSVHCNEDTSFWVPF